MILDFVPRRPGATPHLRGHKVGRVPALVLAATSGPDLTGAACADQDADLMFLGGAREIERAKAVCAACPVISQCLDAALARREEHGVWGGLTSAERRYLTSGTVGRTLETESGLTA